MSACGGVNFATVKKPTMADFLRVEASVDLVAERRRQRAQGAIAGTTDDDR